jgi:3-oxoacyl-[acyl-carrier protein] reductase
VDLGLQDRTALVLGGGGGLGGAIAEALAAEGARVAVADLNLEAAQARADSIDPSGERAVAVRWDLGDLDHIDEHVTQVESRLGRVDVLVNNTGGPPPSAVSGQPVDVWSQQFRSMVLSVIAITDRVLPAMRVNGWGRIVTSASSGVIAPIPNLGLSNALRSSLVGWSKTLAREVASDGITCNLIVPGRIATDRITYLDQQKAEREGRPLEEIQRESTATIPVGRYGRPDEYGQAVAFLASTAASFITGSVLRVDGGMLANV